MPLDLTRKRADAEADQAEAHARRTERTTMHTKDSLIPSGSGKQAGCTADSGYRDSAGRQRLLISPMSSSRVSRNASS